MCRRRGRWDEGENPPALEECLPSNKIGNVWAELDTWSWFEWPEHGRSLSAGDRSLSSHGTSVRPGSIGQKYKVVGKENLSLVFSSLVCDHLFSASGCLDEQFGSPLDATAEQVEAKLRM